MVANLTRWALEADCTVEPMNASMYESSSGEWVKFEEAVEASSNSLQQLQAKIAALIPGIVTSFTLCDEKQFVALTNELRQLSAVR